MFLAYNKLIEIVFWKNKGRKEILNATILSSWFSIGAMILWYIITVLQARRFGADWMWLMAMINTVILFTVSIAWLWMQWSVIRYINQRKVEWKNGKLKSLHVMIAKIVIPFSILVSIVLYLSKQYIAWVIFWDPRLELLIVLLSFFLPLIVLWSIWLEIIKWHKQLVSYHLLWRYSKYIIYLIIITIIFYSSWSIYWPAYWLLWSLIFWFFLVTPIVLNYYKKLPKKEHIYQKKILRTSLPMMITTLSAVIMNQTDIVMLSMYWDTSSVWVYQVAYRLAWLIPFWLSMVNIILWQKIAELFYSHDYKKLQSIITLGSGIWSVVWIVILTIFFLFPNKIMLVFWPDFYWNWILLQILSIWWFINTIAWSTGTYMNMTWKQNIQQITILITATINIILNMILIPKYWGIWAAIASVISFICWNLFIVIYVRKKDSIKTYFSLYSCVKLLHKKLKNYEKQ